MAEHLPSSEEEEDTDRGCRPPERKKPKWSSRVLVRYTLLQIPELLLLALALTLVKRWMELPPWLFWSVLAGWVAIEAILFPFVWRAYDWGHSMGVDELVGSEGVARERLSPSGYVVVRGELWRAEVIGDGSPVEKGETVAITGIRGLLLLVESRSPGCA